MSCQRPWPPGLPYPSDPFEPPCWLGCQPIPPGIVGLDSGVVQMAAARAIGPTGPGDMVLSPLPSGAAAPVTGPWPFGMPPPVDISIGQQPAPKDSLLKNIMVAALPTIIAGLTIYYFTRDKHAEKQMPNPTTGKAVYTGWASPQGPGELTDYLVAHATYVTPSEFARHVDVPSIGLRPVDSPRTVRWLRTRLPSGKEAWIVLGSHVYLAVNGWYDHDAEARLARRWAVQEGMPHSREGR